MKFFTKSELVVIGIILLVVGIASYFNFKVALRRSRDYQRKEDIRDIANALEKYHTDFGILPFNSDDGRILACVDADTREMLSANVENLRNYTRNAVLGVADARQEFEFIPCRWGEDALEDVADADYPAYLARIPVDPQNDDHVSYRYVSNGKRFQILAHLEGSDEAEYDPAIESRGELCGVKICNFGRHFNSPLEKSVEQYENELREKEDLARQQALQKSEK